MSHHWIIGLIMGDFSLH